jgi:hypothetical protein
MVHGLKEKQKGEGKEMGRLEEKREWRGKNDFLLKLFSNHFFQNVKIHSNKKPCIQIMMHNHLLFLILFK